MKEGTRIEQIREKETEPHQDVLFIPMVHDIEMKQTLENYFDLVISERTQDLKKMNILIETLTDSREERKKMYKNLMTQ